MFTRFAIFKEKKRLVMTLGVLGTLIILISVASILFYLRPANATHTPKISKTPHVTQTALPEAAQSTGCNTGVELCPPGRKEEEPVPSPTVPPEPALQTIQPVTEPLLFPPDMGMANVKEKYGAKGDGVTDDTAAIQRALADERDIDHDYFGRPKALYFPAGTYLVSDTLQWRGCCVTLQGQGSGVTIIKLKESAPGFGDGNKPKAIIFTPDGNMSFRQNIWNLGIIVGKNNPGAIGIDYIANNWGSVKEVSITSEDGQGHSGLNMTRSWPGPCLIRNLIVNGFNYGILLTQPEYGPTFEHIALNNQRVAGLSNTDNIAAIRNLQSTNSVPAIINTGNIILLDGIFRSGSPETGGIVNTGFLYARNVSSEGYSSAINHNGAVVPGTHHGEYASEAGYGKFTDQFRSLGLHIEETPEFHDNNLDNWMAFMPTWYGDVAPLQATLNSGKSTIYFPFKPYLVGKITVTVPPTVRRIVGLASPINTWEEGGSLTFKVEGESPHPLIIEQFGYGVTVEHASPRTVVMKTGGYNYIDTPVSGDLFLEDVNCALTISHPHRVWARQLNSEGSQRTQITNQGGTVWVLGIKTEGTASVTDTTNGGKTEILGTLIYPATSFAPEVQNRPAFVSVDSTVSYIYGGSSYVENGFYNILVSETRNGETRHLMKNETDSRMVLYTGF